MAELLSRQYSDVWSEPATKVKREEMRTFFKCDEEEDDSEEGLLDVEISYERVRKALGLMSSSAPPGIDGMPASCLKNGGHMMTVFLVSMFRTSLRKTDVPLSMRKSLIAPIFKGGEKDKASNYRPVALTSHLSKLLERIMRSQMVEYLETRDLMDPGQHGCRPGRSTLT